MGKRAHLKNTFTVVYKKELIEFFEAINKSQLYHNDCPRKIPTALELSTKLTVGPAKIHLAIYYDKALVIYFFNVHSMEESYYEYAAEAVKWLSHTASLNQIELVVSNPSKKFVCFWRKMKDDNLIRYVGDSRSLIK